ncbi:hypothetical protein [Actinomadura sp. 9N407]|uniref:hypothetical protein n=1 Tax=Actinomadura sp. 9N407 TaxID=3375154 RepID=UPI003796AB8E
MQGTVRSYDAGTRTGSVLLDDGTELPFDAEAFAAGGLRLLRFGQRVNLALDDGTDDSTDDGAGAQNEGENESEREEGGGAEWGRIRAITLSTFPLPPA